MSAGTITAQEIFLVSGRNVGDVITVNGTAYTVGTANSFDSVSDAVDADAFTTSNADAVIFTNLSTTTQDVSSLSAFLTTGSNFIFNGAFSGSLQGTGQTGVNLLTFSGSDTNCSFSVYAPAATAYSTIEKGAELTVDEARFAADSDLLVTGTGSAFEAAELFVTGTTLTASAGGTISFAGGTVSGYNGKVTAEKDSFLNMGNVTVADEAQIIGEQATVAVTDDVTISNGGALILNDTQLSSDRDDAVITLDGGRIEVNGVSEFDFSNGDILQAAESSGNEIIISGAGSLNVNTLTGGNTLTVRLVVTEETAADQVMLTVGDLGGTWTLTEENYYVWEGTPLEVQLTLGGELDFIDQRYKLMDADIEYRNIKINITKEMEDLGCCIIRTADGIYLSERKIDMSTIIVNSEWSSKADGATVTYDGNTYTMGTNAFATYNNAVATIKQQSTTPVSIVVNTPQTAVAFDDAQVAVRFSGGESTVTDIAVSAGDIGVAWDGKLNYTGSVTGTFKIDFANFSDASLDKESAYVLLYGAEATGSCSATATNTDLLSTGWNTAIWEGTAIMWHDDLFADADLVIDATLSGKKQGYTYEVNGKEYVYGLTAFASVSTAKGSDLTTSAPASVTFAGDSTLGMINELSGTASGKAWADIDITVTGDLTYTGEMIIGQNDRAIGSLIVQDKIIGSNGATITIKCNDNSDKQLITSGIEGVDKITTTVTGEGNDKLNLGEIVGGSGDKVMEIISSDVTATSITGNVKISGNLNVKDVSGAGEVTAGSIVVSGGSALTVNEKLVIEEGGNTASKVTNLVTTDTGDGAELLLSASDTLTISNLTVKKDLTIGDIANDYTGLILLTGKDTTLTVKEGKTLTVSADQATRFTKFKNYTIGSGAMLVIKGGAMNAEEMDDVSTFYKGKGFKSVTFVDTILSDIGNVNNATLDEVSGFFTGGTFAGTSGNNTLIIGKGENGDFSDYSYDMLGGKNTVSVATGSVLEMIDIKNATTVTIANGMAGDSASTGLDLSGALITSPGAATIKAGNSTSTRIAGTQQEDGSYISIGKSPLGGNNTISFGNGATADLGGDLIAVKSLTLGNGSADDGEAMLTVGVKEGNSYIGGSGNIYGQNIANTIKTGTWSTANIYGDVDLAGGANAVTVGGFGTFNSDSMKNVAKFTLGNGGLNKLNYGSWDRTTVEIDGDYEAPMMANSITIGNFADMVITGIVNNGGVMSGTGTTVKVGSASTLSIGRTAASLAETGKTILAFDGLADLTLSAGKEDDTTMTATTVDIFGSVTGTEAKNTVSLATNSDLTIHGSMDLLGNANAVTVAAKAQLYVAGDLRNISALTLGAGGANKGDEVVTGYNKAIATINGNFSGGGGSSTITIGNHAEFSASNIYLSELGGNFAITVGSNAKVSTGAIEGVNKLTVSNGIAFAYEAGGSKDQYSTQFTSGMITGTTGKDAITIGNFTNTSIAAISLGQGDDTLKIGNFNSKVNGYEADVNISGGIDFGSGKNTLSIGTQSCLNTAMIENVTTLTLAAGKTTADGDYYTELYCSGITGTELADSITIGKLANVIVDGDIDLTYGEETGMKNAINLGSLGELQAGDVTGINKLTVGAGTYNKADDTVNWTVLDIDDLTGTDQDDVFTAGNYSMFSVNSIDGAGSVKGDKLTIGQGATAIVRGTISGIDSIAIGNDTEVYASKEAMSVLKDAAGDNETIKWFDIGSADVAKGFTDAASELADNKGIDKRPGAVFKNGTDGWLSNGDIQDFIDYIKLDSDGDWEIADASGNLKVTLHEITTSGMEDITTASSVSYEDGKWTISDYDSETMVVCVEIAKVGEDTMQGTFGYTTTLA